MTVATDKGFQQNFSRSVVSWQREHGRKHLPWMNTKDPYRVWLSEIMLQQTQVVTVLRYFDRFLTRFPTIESLADAPLDEVLAIWSGLGYYSRARNLHQCAQTVVTQFDGEFPQSASALSALPGIGPSTAAAIASFCFNERVSIFDGNVKRVMARYLGFQGDIADRTHEKELRFQVNQLVPDEQHAADMPAYTQGLMDLGATVCVRAHPRCGECPLISGCMAHASGQQQMLPVKTRRLKRKSQIWTMLVVQRAHDGAVWLERRGPDGVWASLHAFPCGSDVVELLGSVGLPPTCAHRHGQPFVHVLTHLDMVIQPIHVDVGPDWQPRSLGMNQPDGVWATPKKELLVGVPVPVRKMLAELSA